MGAERSNGDAFGMLTDMYEAVIKFSDFVERTVRYLGAEKSLLEKEVMVVYLSSLRLMETSQSLEKLAESCVRGKEHEGGQGLEV